MFWLSYECFSILSNAFLIKSAISHNSCDETSGLVCAKQNFKQNEGLFEKIECVAPE